jgi:hypothetical protein
MLVGRMWDCLKPLPNFLKLSGPSNTRSAKKLVKRCDKTPKRMSIASLMCHIFGKRSPYGPIIISAASRAACPRSPAVTISAVEYIDYLTTTSISSSFQLRERASHALPAASYSISLILGCGSTRSIIEEVLLNYSTLLLH